MMSAKNTLGIGIAGTGYFGAFHARALRAVSGVRLVAVCDRQPELAHRFAEEHGCAAAADFEALLADRTIDAVAIATPHHLHAPMAIAAAKAGKHILLEKPMARTAAECDTILAAVAPSGVTLMVGQLLHFALPSLVARRILDSGDLGRPVTGTSTLIKLWMEENRRDWHLDPATGGGMLMTAGIHPLDLMVWLMGERVGAVFAAAGALQHVQAADDTAFLLLRFADGRFAQISSVGYRDGGVVYGMDLVCERGTLRIDFERGVSIGRGGRWTEVPASAEPDWMLRAVEREWAAMAAAIRREAPVAVTGAYGRHIIGCIEAALQSSRERREVSVAG
jgi:predicted dehydrogenase